MKMLRASLSLAIIVSAASMTALAQTTPPPKRAAHETAAGKSLSVSSLDLELMQQGFGRPAANKNLGGGPLQIAGRRFPTGIATHADSLLAISLDGRAVRFHAICGIDDDSLKSPASVRFHVLADGKEIWSSSVLKAGMPGIPVNLPLRGVRILTHKVDDGGDGNRSDHADWAAAEISFGGKPPVATAPAKTSVKTTVFNLELYYSSDKDRDFAKAEAKRMAKLLAELAPHVQLKIQVLKSKSPIRKKFDSNGPQDVPNQPPSSDACQSLLITDEDIGAAGWAGPGAGCLSKKRMEEKLARGANSADISLHEWMHTIQGQKINGRTLGWLHDNDKHGFPEPDSIDKAGDGVWHRWYKFYLRWD